MRTSHRRFRVPVSILCIALGVVFLLSAGDGSAYLGRTNPATSGFAGAVVSVILEWIAGAAFLGAGLFGLTRKKFGFTITLIMIALVVVIAGFIVNLAGAGLAPWILNLIGIVLAILYYIGWRTSEG